ncbi:hypothetical protein [Halosimplex pelagicum]|uniref:Uncharacterized protein n=1 Tax=Halosimplex pelagicum TaxID=869886 RepID=A0A7D5PEF4_9EURY|nr:hypothetical protein [Halosimplex pelagicum]QLH81499.1 hypothetical protein HZS54_07605 [Halosimplex pelagicum]
MTDGTWRSRRAVLAGVGTAAVGGVALALGTDRSPDPPSTRRADVESGRTYRARNSRSVRGGDAVVEQLLLATPTLAEGELTVDVLGVTAATGSDGESLAAALDGHRLGARTPGAGATLLYDGIPSGGPGEVPQLHGAPPTAAVERSAVASALDSSSVDASVDAVSLVPHWDRASAFDAFVARNLVSLRDALVVAVDGHRNGSTRSADDVEGAVLVVPPDPDQKSESEQFRDDGQRYSWRAAGEPWRAHVVRYRGLAVSGESVDLLVRQGTRLDSGRTVRQDLRLSR